MVGERYTENLTLKEMKISLNENGTLFDNKNKEYGKIFLQGDIANFDTIKNCLQKAGGKPDLCELNDFSKSGNGKAQPEYIITFNDKQDTIIVVECKKLTKDHVSEKLNQPKKYAVDGVLYYAKFLKDEYNVIAIAISGTKKDNFKANTYYWRKLQENYEEYKKATDIILEPLNYLRLINGEKMQKQFSLEEIRETAIQMHEILRGLSIENYDKPIFIAGLLIALVDNEFYKEYENSTNFSSIIIKINNAIDRILNIAEVNNKEVIKLAFKGIENNETLKKVPLK